MPTSSTKQSSHSSPSHGKSKHSHHRSSSGSGTSSSPPKHKVIILLPPRMQPPVNVSPPSHRTAVPIAPALQSRSRSIPASNRSPKFASSSPPRTTHISQHPPSHGSPPRDHAYRQYPSGPSTGSSTLGYTITPMARSSSNHSYQGARATITPLSEDDYYDHPAVRAYEMQKAVEQAQWHRRMQQEREQKQRQAQAQMASASGTSSYYAHSYQPRW
ncbi:hypothetical protein FA15DRAFT_758402 [Coprinopsis marcescibilis]|uniref:Uncharacterized protein n=1 Tax=Coprinopsis marcescibilis TaxID=230819 RepID=A0A5C3KP99_COPMA|nr:hypothetical protein FA15DRAFT_758402 [Coprinopsis marcescibilis]